jgi:hypothetical protein
MGEDAQLLRGWHVDAAVKNGGQRWDATKLGTIFGADLFRTRAPGVRLGG